MSDEYYHKILNNTASETEKKQFFAELENNPEERDEFYRYKNLYVLSSLNSERYRKQQNENFSRFWNKVQSRRSTKTIKLWMRYAAIFVVASFLGFLADYLLNPKASVTASLHIVYSSEKGSVSTVQLEDGSAIWLSSGTNLIIDQNQKGETKVKLDGEAFFDLIPNPDRNFVVDLGHFLVRDIGTCFNIRAYKSESTISTTLVKGRIEMTKNSGEQIVSVKPGEFVKYDKSDHQITISQQDPTIVTAWKDGKFVFIDQPLSQICKELENWYNVEIQIEDPKLASTRYTSVIKRTTTVQMVLKILAITDQIKYTITDKKEGKDLISITK